METGVVTRPPVIPSKWDIIPIHASDVASYKRCRRYWNWTSPARNNLRRRVDIHGIKMELWFGTGIHYALEEYYNPLLQRDPVESFKTWYQLQWDGGVVGHDWLDRTYDIRPKQLDDGTFKIRGLRNLLPNIEVVQEEFELHYELGVGMLTFYKEWAKKNDEFVTVAAESVFSIPLGFESIDTREDSPNYGKKSEVHARGKRDAVVFEPMWEKYGINDHKTASRIDEDYFVKLEKDEQITQYLWATMREAEMEDLPWSGQMVDRAYMTALRKNFPKPPNVLKNGKLSLDKQQGTNADLFEAAIEASPELSKWFVSDPKAQQYFTYLCDQGDDLFVLRNVVGRNRYEIEAFERHLIMTAKEMLDPDLNIYPNPTGSWLCTGCAFRAPCIAADDGSDWEGMLNDAYELNRDR